MKDMKADFTAPEIAGILRLLGVQDPSHVVEIGVVGGPTGSVCAQNTAAAPIPCRRAADTGKKTRWRHRKKEQKKARRRYRAGT